MARKPRYPMKRTEVSILVKRLVREDQIQITRDIVLFYKAFAETPRWDFWSVYEPGFPLNCMAYFLSEEGREKVSLDLAVFDLNIDAEPEAVLTQDKVGDDRTVRRTPNAALADLLS